MPEEAVHEFFFFFPLLLFFIGYRLLAINIPLYLEKHEKMQQNRETQKKRRSAGKKSRAAKQKKIGNARRNSQDEVAINRLWQNSARGAEVIKRVVFFCLVNHSISLMIKSSAPNLCCDPSFLPSSIFSVHPSLISAFSVLPSLFVP